MEIGAVEGIILVAVILGAYYWGRASMLADIVRDLKKKGVIPSKDTAQVNESTAEDEIIKIENHQGVVYAFGNNDRFLGQGKTYDDLFNSIKERFPNQNFRVQKEGTEDAEFEKMVTSIFNTFGDKK